MKTVLISVLAAAILAPAAVGAGERSNQSDLTETGYGESSDFSFGQSEQVSQWARVFGSSAQADSSYMRTVTIALVDCLAKELEAASDKKSTIKVTGFADILVIQRGQTLTTTTFTGFGNPVAAPFEQGLARIAAKRSGAKIVGPKA
jgi:hypothetical protein